MPQGHTATEPDKALWASPASIREWQWSGPESTPSVPEKARKMRRHDAEKTEDMTPPSGKRREKYKDSKGEKRVFILCPLIIYATVQVHKT